MLKLVHKAPSFESEAQLEVSIYVSCSNIGDFLFRMLSSLFTSSSIRKRFYPPRSSGKNICDHV